MVAAAGGGVDAGTIGTASVLGTFEISLKVPLMRVDTIPVVASVAINATTASSRTISGAETYLRDGVEVCCGCWEALATGIATEPAGSSTAGYSGCCAVEEVKDENNDRAIALIGLWDSGISLLLLLEVGRYAPVADADNGRRFTLASLIV